MTHLSVPEWGQVKIGIGGFSVAQAEMLVAAADAHPLGGDRGSRILTDHRHFLQAKQMVGVISGPGCSLEILPKIDSAASDDQVPTIRRRLVTLLDLALGLQLESGADAQMSYGAENLLDIFIRLFAQNLSMQVRRGLPRLYLPCREDLPVFRGRIDLVRQFTVHVMRPDRLACEFDVLSNDIPLMQILKATVVFLGKLSRVPGTRRLLDALRFVLADVTDVSPASLPWDRVQVDRTNRHWSAPLALARLLMQRGWQETHRDRWVSEGVSLLFPMQQLFEQAVAALMRRLFFSTDIEVVVQGGRRWCLGDWANGKECEGKVFQTRPDIILKRGSRVLAVIDTKWKRLSADPLDRKNGVNQSDVYQMMAYARLYRCARLMLLYPAVPGSGSSAIRRFGVAGGSELLALGQIDLSEELRVVKMQLMVLMSDLLDAT